MVNFTQLANFFSHEKPNDALFAEIAEMDEWEAKRQLLVLRGLVRASQLEKEALEKETADKLDAIKALAELAFRDHKTGLPNDRAIETEYEMRPLHARRTVDRAPQGYVLVVDLDGFKNVNDTFGHDVGDRVLTTVAHSMWGRMRGSDMIARTGGDEFTAIVEASRHELAALDLGLRETVAKGLVGANFPGDLTTLSIGAAATDFSTPYKEIHAAADAAMYNAKKAGGDGIRYHVPLKALP